MRAPTPTTKITTTTIGTTTIGKAIAIITKTTAKRQRWLTLGHSGASSTSTGPGFPYVDACLEIEIRECIYKLQATSYALQTRVVSWARIITTPYLQKRGGSRVQGVRGNCINVGKNAKQEKCFFLQRKCIQQIHRYKYIQ